MIKQIIFGQDYLPGWICYLGDIIIFKVRKKALPLVQNETVKLDVFVDEKVVCRVVSSLVVTVDFKSHAVNLKR